MLFYPHMPICRRLAKHSLRLRLMLELHDRCNPGYLSHEYIRELSGLIIDLQGRLDESCWRDPKWARGDLPNGVAEAGAYLAWPEVVGTEDHMAAVWRCDVGTQHAGHISSAVKWLAAVMLRRAWAQGVPLVPVRMHRDPAEVDCDHAAGLTPLAARDDPFCYGRAVEFAHFGEVDWTGHCCDWLQELAEESAIETGAIVAFGPQWPTSIFVCDEDGVMCPCDGAFPARSETRGEERERLLMFYMGKAVPPVSGAPPVWLPGSGIEPADWLGRKHKEPWQPLERDALQTAIAEQRKLVEAHELREARRVADKALKAVLRPRGRSYDDL